MLSGKMPPPLAETGNLVGYKQSCSRVPKRAPIEDIIKVSIRAAASRVAQYATKLNALTIWLRPDEQFDRHFGGTLGKNVTKPGGVRNMLGTIECCAIGSVLPWCDLSSRAQMKTDMRSS